MTISIQNDDEYKMITLILKERIVKSMECMGIFALEQKATQISAPHL